MLEDVFKDRDFIIDALACKLLTLRASPPAHPETMPRRMEHRWGGAAVIVRRRRMKEEMEEEEEEEEEEERTVLFFPQAILVIFEMEKYFFCTE